MKTNKIFLSFILLLVCGCNQNIISVSESITDEKLSESFDSNVESESVSEVETESSTSISESENSQNSNEELSSTVSETETSTDDSGWLPDIRP